MSERMPGTLRSGVRSGWSRQSGAVGGGSAAGQVFVTERKLAMAVALELGRGHPAAGVASGDGRRLGTHPGSLRDDPGRLGAGLALTFAPMAVGHDLAAQRGRVLEATDAAVISVPDVAGGLAGLHARRQVVAWAERRGRTAARRRGRGDRRWHGRRRGLVVSDASTWLMVHVRVRMLVVHQAEGFRERGMALSAEEHGGRLDGLHGAREPSSLPRPGRLHREPGPVAEVGVVRSGAAAVAGSRDTPRHHHARCRSPLDAESSPADRCWMKSSMNASCRVATGARRAGSSER